MTLFSFRVLKQAGCLFQQPVKRRSRHFTQGLGLSENGDKLCLSPFFWAVFYIDLL